MSSAMQMQVNSLIGVNSMKLCVGLHAEVHLEVCL